MVNRVAPMMSCEYDPQLSLALFIHDSDPSVQHTATLNLSDELSLYTYSGASFMRDDSLSGLGIYESDLLLVDRRLKPKHDDIVLYRLEGELSCRKLDMKSGLLHCGEHTEVICLKDHVGLVIEGVVRHIIHSLR